MRTKTTTQKQIQLKEINSPYKVHNIDIETPWITSKTLTKHNKTYWTNKLNIAIPKTANQTKKLNKHSE